MADCGAPAQGDVAYEGGHLLAGHPVCVARGASRLVGGWSLGSTFNAGGCVGTVVLASGVHALAMTAKSMAVKILHVDISHLVAGYSVCKLYPRIA